MKKSLSLIEVIISVMLLSTVILTLLQIKENNLFILSSTEKKTIHKSYLNSASLASPIIDIENRNEKIFLSDQLEFDDDTLRQSIKDVTIQIKDSQSKSLDLNGLTIQSYESSYTLEQITQKFFTFRLQ